MAGEQVKGTPETPPSTPEKSILTALLQAPARAAGAIRRSLNACLGRDGVNNDPADSLAYAKTLHEMHGGQTDEIVMAKDEFPAHRAWVASQDDPWERYKASRNR